MAAEYQLTAICRQQRKVTAPDKPIGAETGPADVLPIPETTIMARNTEQHGIAAPAGPADVPAKPSLMEFVLRGADNLLVFFPPEAFHEDIVGVRRLGRMFYTVSHPEAIKHILIDAVENYPRSPHVRRLVEPVAKHGLLATQGEQWRRQRRTMAPAFDHRSVLRYEPIVVEETERLLIDWGRLPTGSSFDVLPEMLRLTLTIISRTMFSIDAPDIQTLVRDSILSYQAEARVGIADILGMPEWFPRLKRNDAVAARVFKDFNGTIDRLIDERRANGGAGRDDLLSRLVLARDEVTGETMPTEEVRDQVITMFWAGHETTAFSLTWTLYLLSQHPQCRSALQAELDTLLAGRAPERDDHEKLHYTKMVLQEALRLYPPVYSLARYALNDDTLLGQHIPAGSRIAVVPWIIHRHSLYWDRPHSFDPGRFTSDQARSRARFSYIPMGGGPRVCIGSALAYSEATIILAMIAQRFELGLDPHQSVVPQGMLTLGPKHGMRMFLRRRP